MRSPSEKQNRPPARDGERGRGLDGGMGARRRQPQEIAAFKSQDERAVLVGAGPASSRLHDASHLEELHQLALTAGARVVGHLHQIRQSPHPASYLGSGKLLQLKDLCRACEATLVIADDDLSPAQVRNMEKTVDLRVVDRSELIIDIFSARAGTRQARLQVELAQLKYLAPRLKRMWPHLDRITAAGGIGSRGPGEKQIEVDRRIIQKRIRDLGSELRNIEAHRARQAKGRETLFKVALVGYTNAGKSTLMNLLTRARVHVEDKLFATLDTRTRRWQAAPDSQVLLSDTVGFISKLPHHLVASFHATLEEVREADLLLHVVDAADAGLGQRIKVVHEVLRQIEAARVPELLVLNKCDLLPDPTEVTILSRRHRAAAAVSAKRGVGLEELAEQVRSRSKAHFRQVDLDLPCAEGAILALVSRLGTVISRKFAGERCLLRVSLPAATWGRVKERLARYQV